MNNILGEIQALLKGKYGTVFMILIGIFAVLFFVQIMPALIKFLIIFAIIFFAFRFISKKS